MNNLIGVTWFDFVMDPFEDIFAEAAAKPGICFLPFEKEILGNNMFRMFY